MKDSVPQILFSSAGRGWNALDAALVHMPPGIARAPGGELHLVGMHFGPPVNARCSVGGTRIRGLQKPGDISFVPAGVDGCWEDDADCQILRLSLRPALLKQVAEELGRDAAKIELRPRLQLRDARIEALGWAIKADLEADTPSDPLYIWRQHDSSQDAVSQQHRDACPSICDPPPHRICAGADRHDDDASQ